MQAGDAEVVQRVVQHGDVAEAHDPLGVAAQGGKVQVIEQVHGAVAAAGAPDGADGGVIERSLQIGGALLGGAGLLEVLPADARAQLHLQAPAFGQRNTVAQLLHRDGARSGDDGDGVTGTEGRRDRHGHGAKVSSLVHTG